MQPERPLRRKMKDHSGSTRRSRASRSAAAREDRGGLRNNDDGYSCVAWQASLRCRHSQFDQGWAACLSADVVTSPGLRNILSTSPACISSTWII